MNQNNSSVNHPEKSNPSVDSLPSDLDEAVLRELFDLPNWIDLLKYERSFDQKKALVSLPPLPTRMPLSSIDHLELVISPPEAFRDSCCDRRPLFKRKFVQECRPLNFTNFTSSSLPKKRSKLMISKENSETLF